MRLFLLAGGVALSVAVPAASAQASCSHIALTRTVGAPTWVRPPANPLHYTPLGGSRFGHKVG